MMSPEIPEILKGRLQRPVAVLGAGVSGEGAASLVTRLGSLAITYDRDEVAFTEASARGHDLVVYSPGFPPLHPWLEIGRKAGCLCLSEIDFASLFWRGRLIAVTGTNGKTTLTEFLVHALRSVGGRAVAAGNIGTPLSQVVLDEDGGSADTVAVCEVSSFQAELLGHLRAEALLWTNFAEDHLERHGSLDNYFDAKAELVARTAPGAVFVGTSVAGYADLMGRDLAQACRCASEGQAPDPHLAGSVFEHYPQRENFILAAAWWKATGREERALYAAASTFALGRHRLARVATVGQVTYWNDSKATNFHAVEAAILGFASPVVLIAGGRAKGGDIGGFVRRIAPRVSHAALMGETGPALAATCALCGVSHTLCASLEEAVRVAAANAKPGGNVLLSPGFASFDMFQSYQDRGDRFERAVAELSTAPV